MSDALKHDVPVTVLPLARDQVAALRAQPFTYSSVGATLSDPPSGFKFFTRTRVMNHEDFETASDDLMSWQVQRRAGLKVAASSLNISVGSVVVMHLGFGALALRIPCRVVYVVDEPMHKASPMEP